MERNRKVVETVYFPLLLSTCYTTRSSSFSRWYRVALCVRFSRCHWESVQDPPSRNGIVPRLRLCGRSCIEELVLNGQDTVHVQTSSNVHIHVRVPQYICAVHNIHLYWYTWACTVCVRMRIHAHIGAPACVTM